MTELKMSETSLLGSSKKSYGRSYGTTQRSLQETYIKHYVAPAETLQGIALKYGVSVEQIKRANKLYTNDSIFLRTTLSIPVGDQPLPAHVLENATASANSNPSHSALRTNVIMEDSSPSDDEEGEKAQDEEVDGKKGATADAGGATEEVETKRDTTMDFFNRIDRQLREEKSKMTEIESTSHISEIESMTSSVSSSSVRSSVPQSPSRRASTPAIGAENSYQNNTVRMSSIDRRRSADVVAMPNFSGKGVLRTPIWAE